MELKLERLPSFPQAFRNSFREMNTVKPKTTFRNLLKLILVNGVYPSSALIAFPLCNDNDNTWLFASPYSSQEVSNNQPLWRSKQQCVQGNK